MGQDFHQSDLAPDRRGARSLIQHCRQEGQSTNILLMVSRSSSPDCQADEGVRRILARSASAYSGQGSPY
jgi:hypothetical protein